MQWEFGAGLSYTEYKYSNLRTDKKSFKAGDTLTVSVDVTNTGSREGMEPVLLFSSDLTASITPDIRRLRAFDKVTLKPGETKTVTFKVPAESLAFVDADCKWKLEAGEFVFRCGNNNVPVTCTETSVLD